jgi:dienelactone hydrolase
MADMWSGADILASQGYHVYAPDIFKGDYMDLKLMPTLSDDEK